eukprot:7740144-Pyramimonas_sp.AAC.1
MKRRRWRRRRRRTTADTPAIPQAKANTTWLPTADTAVPVHPPPPTLKIPMLCPPYEDIQTQRWLQG